LAEWIDIDFLHLHVVGVLVNFWEFGAISVKVKMCKTFVTLHFWHGLNLPPKFIL